MSEPSVSSDDIRPGVIEDFGTEGGQDIATEQGGNASRQPSQASQRSVGGRGSQHRSKTSAKIGKRPLLEESNGDSDSSDSERMWEQFGSIGECLIHDSAETVTVTALVLFMTERAA